MSQPSNSSGLTPEEQAMLGTPELKRPTHPSSQPPTTSGNLSSSLQRLVSQTETQIETADRAVTSGLIKPAANRLARIVLDAPQKIVDEATAIIDDELSTSPMSDTAALITGLVTSFCPPDAYQARQPKTLAGRTAKALPSH